MFFIRGGEGGLFNHEIYQLREIPSAASKVLTMHGDTIKYRNISYAEMYITDADPDTIAITAGSPADGTDWLDGDTTTTFTVSGGRITYTGTETATFDIDFSGEIDASTNLTASVWLYKSNSAIAGTKRRQAITAATAENVTTGCLVSLATNDYIEVFFDVNTNGSIYINNASLKVKKL